MIHLQVIVIFGGFIDALIVNKHMKRMKAM